MKVALLQTRPYWQQKAANIAVCSELIAGLSDDCRLIVLPEMFTTGFSVEQVAELAETDSGQTVQWMRDTARTKNAALCGSVIISENNRFFNRLFFVLPDGSFQCYDKRHLFAIGGEHAVFSAGNKRLTVSYEGWRICPLLCYDLRFPVWSRNYDNDFDLLIYVASWPQARISVWNTLLPARAIENQCYVAGVNRVGDDGLGVAHKGQSKVINFKGEMIEAANDAEMALLVDLSLPALQQFRLRFPAWRDADKFSIL